MNAKERVLQVWPDARCSYWPGNNLFVVESADPAEPHIYGAGQSETDAWGSAAGKLPSHLPSHAQPARSVSIDPTDFICPDTGEAHAYGINEGSGEWQCASCGKLRPLASPSHAQEERAGREPHGFEAWWQQWKQSSDASLDSWNKTCAQKAWDAALKAPSPERWIAPEHDYFCLEQELRTVMWLNHGHTGMYGDDGEMQCSECSKFGCWDYRNAPMDEVRKAYQMARFERRPTPPAPKEDR
jgi:hypothetical protein